MTTPAVNTPAVKTPAVKTPAVTTPAVARPHGTAGEGHLSAVWCGEAVTEAAAEGFAGRVEGVFRDGFYVSGPSQTIFAVLGPRACPGPLHLITEVLAVLPALHDRVTLSGAVLAVGRLRIGIAGCSRWAPRLPRQLRAGSDAWHRIDLGVEPELVTAWGPVTDDIRRGDLASVFRRLEGRGAGLTPSGDDVLAGIVLVCAIDPRRRAALDDLARTARTTRLSRAFLRWAAAGQSIEPAHALLDAAASDDPTGMQRAAESLAAIGATSGRALVTGAALAATELPSRLAPRPTVV